jgi:hypothetical protein
MSIEWSSKFVNIRRKLSLLGLGIFIGVLFSFGVNFAYGDYGMTVITILAIIFTVVLSLISHLTTGTFE